jgi:hypothetical protein
MLQSEATDRFSMLKRAGNIDEPTRPRASCVELPKERVPV